MSADKAMKELDQLMASGGLGFENKHTKKTKKYLDGWEHKEQALTEDQAKKTAYEKAIAGESFERAFAARAERADRH